MLLHKDTMLPMDIYVLIAKVDLKGYRSMLAIPRFARYTLEHNKEFRMHFTVKSVDRFTTTYTLNGKIHRDDDLPAVIEYNENETSIYGKGIEYWYRHGLLHRWNDLPAEVESNGTMQWYWNGKHHRENDKPAVVNSSGDRAWFYNDKCHRDNDLPAIITHDGHQIWCKNGLVHRDNDKPAVVMANGEHDWYQNGKRYRTDGSFIVVQSGTYIYGYKDEYYDAAPLCYDFYVFVRCLCSGMEDGVLWFSAFTPCHNQNMFSLEAL